MTIVIKYNLDRDDLVEGKYYSTKFDLNKFYGIIPSLDDEFNANIEDKLKIIDSLDYEIVMKYVGISRIDGLSLFVLDHKQILRNQKINEILG
jgi:hypothetical protein